MSKVKFGLTKKEEKLYAKALYHQRLSEEYLMDFRNSLKNRFPDSEVIDCFEEYDLWTLNQSGDLSFDSEAVEAFWKDVRKELKQDD